VNVSHQHYLYTGVFADGAPLPRELEGMLDALLVACVVLSDVRSARHIVLSLEQAEVPSQLTSATGCHCTEEGWRSLMFRGIIDTSAADTPTSGTVSRICSLTSCARNSYDTLL
jgi:hypothetical protein